MTPTAIDPNIAKFQPVFDLCRNEKTLIALTFDQWSHIITCLPADDPVRFLLLTGIIHMLQCLSRELGELHP